MINWRSPANNFFTASDRIRIACIGGYIEALGDESDKSELMREATRRPRS